MSITGVKNPVVKNPVLVKHNDVLTGYESIKSFCKENSAQRRFT